MRNRVFFSAIERSVSGYTSFATDGQGEIELLSVSCCIVSKYFDSLFAKVSI
jgi:hypothetical protein